MAGILGVLIMKVKSKIILIMVVSAVVTFIATAIIVKTLFVNNIIRQESLLANDNYQRAMSILKKEQNIVESYLLDWAAWDYTYQFIKDKNEGYIRDNLQGNSLHTLDLNFILYINNDGKIIFSKINEIQSKDTMSAVTELKEGLKLEEKFKYYKSVSAPVTGIFMFSGKPAIVSISPVTTSDGMSSPEGILVMGKIINEQLIEYMEEVLMVQLEFKDVQSVNISNLGNADYSHPYNGAEIFTITGKSELTTYALIRDFNGNPAAYMVFRIPRVIYKAGVKVTLYFSVLFFAVFIFVTMIHLFLVDKLIIKRIKLIHKFIGKVKSNRDVNVRIQLSGDDELSELADNTNNMLEEIESYYSKIREISETDVTTTLKNRAYMENILKIADECSECDIWIILGDVNGLKLANDSFGHQSGDSLLRKISDIFKKCCAEDDIPARWGGDEFLILVKNKEESYAKDLVNRIKEECRLAADDPIKISIALGMAGKDEQNFEMSTVLKLAEKRMYRNKLLESRSARSAILSSLEQSLHEKSIETEEHTKRIKSLCLLIGKRMGLSQDELDELALLGSLHDIGKIGIPENILLKSGKLTDEEWVIMKTHSEIGYRIAGATLELAHIADEILSHHERYDGTGYPQGLKGENIPKLSRLISIVDSFDVMTHDRNYKKAMDIKDVIVELKNCSGKQFDPQMVEQFLELLDENPDIVDQNDVN